jgi:spore germination protein YaaH
MRRWLVAVVLVASTVAAASPLATSAAGAGARASAPGRELTSDQRRARAKTIAWIVTWDHARVMASLTARADVIGEVTPYWFRVKDDGTRLENRDGAMDREVLALASAHDMSVVPTVTNEFDATRVSAVLATARTRTRHVNQLTTLAANANFDGIELDYEGVTSADRPQFTQLVEALATSLHARNRTLAVTVPPATAATTSAYDYAAIGRAADEVRVLAYDYNDFCGGAGPIAPIDWVRRVVTFLEGEVPRRKLVLGTPLYGYDWPATGCATSRTWRDTTAIRSRRNGTLAWSVPFQTRRMVYTTAQHTRRVVWFEDYASTKAKASVAEEHRLRGVALWRIGGEDPRTWSALVAELGQPRN